MAKKKKKEKDFQKIKLKVGRRLLRGTNDTKTDFKSKKIVLKESESRSRDPIKTLSNSVGINSQMKLLCLSKLSESLNTQTVRTNAGLIVNTIAKYINDDDKRVRSDAIKCIKQCISVFNTNANNSICPLMTMILNYVNCGMTHIDPNIGIDSIKLLSHLMENCDNSLYDQLMEIMITRIGSKNNVDANDYEVCCKLVSLITKNDANKSTIFESREPPLIKWSTNNYFIDIQKFSIDYNKPQISCNLSFQTNSSVDVKDKFMTHIKKLVVNDLKILFSGGKQLTFTVSEARKANSVLNIGSMFGLTSAVINGEIPSINITSINTNKKTSRQQ